MKPISHQFARLAVRSSLASFALFVMVAGIGQSNRADQELIEVGLRLCVVAYGISALLLWIYGWAVIRLMRHRILMISIQIFLPGVSGLIIYFNYYRK